MVDLGKTSYIQAGRVKRRHLMISGNNALGLGYLFLLHLAYNGLSSTPVHTVRHHGLTQGGEGKG